MQTLNFQLDDMTHKEIKNEFFIHLVQRYVKLNTAFHPNLNTIQHLLDEMGTWQGPRSDHPTTASILTNTNPCSQALNSYQRLSQKSGGYYGSRLFFSIIGHFKPLLQTVERRQAEKHARKVFGWTQQNLWFIVSGELNSYSSLKLICTCDVLVSKLL